MYPSTFHHWQLVMAMISYQWIYMKQLRLSLKSLSAAIWRGLQTARPAVKWEVKNNRTERWEAVWNS